MSSLEIYIGKSKYTINCQDSEKGKLTKLSESLNKRVNELSLKLRGVDEKTILMLSAITIEEELSKINNNRDSSQSPDDKLQQEYKNTIEILTKNIEDIAIYIEKLANNIQKS